jgi:ketosteroid isomerase-like protein
VNKASFEKWIQNYQKAWKSNDKADIQALFTEDATYLTQAFREPWTGRETIVKEWIGRADWSNEPKDLWSFEYKWLAIEGDIGVVDGITNYPERDEIYQNVWTIRLAEDGRCREFREYWIRKSDVKL